MPRGSVLQGKPPRKGQTNAKASRCGEGLCGESAGGPWTQCTRHKDLYPDCKKKKKKSVPWRQSHQYGRVCTIPEEQGELDWGESSGRGGGFATHLRKAAVRTGDAITASCGTLGKSLDFTYSS